MRKIIINTFSLVFLLFLATGFASCSQEDEYTENTGNTDSENTEGLIPVKINVAGITESVTPLTRADVKAQTFTQTLKGNGMTIEATFAPDTTVQTRGTSYMTKGVVYRVFVSNTDGSGTQQFDVTAGDENTAFISLAPGSYVFRAYSYNKTSMPVYSTGSDNILDDKISVTPDEGDLLYAYMSKTISATDNVVSLTFTHLFNLIKLSGTVVRVNQYMDGSDQLLATTSKSYYLPKVVNGTATVAGTYGNGTLSFLSDSYTITPVASTSQTTTLTWATPLGGQSTYDVTPLLFSTGASQNISFTLTNLGLQEDGSSDNTITYEVNIPTDNLPMNTFTVNATLSPGVAYTLDLKIYKNLYWSKGNLKYDGGYSICTNQYDTDGSLFPWNVLTPSDTPLTSATSWTAANDPCTQLGGGWRTPSYYEQCVLTSGASDAITTNYMPVSDALGNQPTADYTGGGAWIGLSDPSVVVDALNKNAVTDLLTKYMFLPEENDAYSEAYYMSNTLSTTTRAKYMGIVSTGATALLDWQYLIRCISDYE